MGFGAEMRDFVAGFKVGSDFMERRDEFNRREKLARDKMDSDDLFRRGYDSQEQRDADNEFRRRGAAITGQGGDSSAPAGGSSGGGARQGPRDQEAASAERMRYYVENYGLPPHVAAGIVGNAWHESGGYSGARGDGGHSWGDYQFNNNGGEGRVALQWMKANGKNPNDWRAQADFVMARLGVAPKDPSKDGPNLVGGAPYSRVMQQMMGARDPGQAAVIFSKGYERPAAAAAYNDRRVGWANRAAQLYKPGAGGTTWASSNPAQQQAMSPPDRMPPPARAALPQQMAQAPQAMGEGGEQPDQYAPEEEQGLIQQFASGGVVGNYGAPRAYTQPVGQAPGAFVPRRIGTPRPGALPIGAPIEGGAQARFRERQNRTIMPLTDLPHVPEKPVEKPMRQRTPSWSDYQEGGGPGAGPDGGGWGYAGGAHGALDAGGGGYESFSGDASGMTAADTSGGWGDNVGMGSGPSAGDVGTGTGGLYGGGGLVRKFADGGMVTDDDLPTLDANYDAQPADYSADNHGRVVDEQLDANYSARGTVDPSHGEGAPIGATSGGSALPSGEQSYSEAEDARKRLQARDEAYRAMKADPKAAEQAYGDAPLPGQGRGRNEPAKREAALPGTGRGNTSDAALDDPMQRPLTGGEASDIARRGREERKPARGDEGVRGAGDDHRQEETRTALRRESALAAIRSAERRSRVAPGSNTPPSRGDEGVRGAGATREIDKPLIPDDAPIHGVIAKAKEWLSRSPSANAPIPPDAGRGAIDPKEGAGVVGSPPADPNAAAPLPPRRPADLKIEPARTSAAVAAGLKVLNDQLAGNASQGSALPNGAGQQSKEGSFARNADAPTTQDIEAGIKTVDPDGKLNRDDAMLKLLNDQYDFWLAQGRPDRAANAAAGILMYGRKVAQNSGYLAIAALDDGNVNAAARFIQRAYDSIPDGQSIVYKPLPNGNISYQTRGPDGKMTPAQEATPDQLRTLASDLASGRAWAATMFTTAMPGTGRQRRTVGGNLTTAAPRVAAPPKPTAAERDAANEKTAQDKRIAELNVQAELETDPTRQKALQGEAKFVPFQDAAEANRDDKKPPNRDKINEVLDAEPDIKPEQKSVLGDMAESIKGVNPGMSEGQAVRIAKALADPKGGRPEPRGTKFQLPNLPSFFATWDVMQKTAAARRANSPAQAAPAPAPPKAAPKPAPVQTGQLELQ